MINLRDVVLSSGGIQVGSRDADVSTAEQVGGVVDTYRAIQAQKDERDAAAFNIDAQTDLQIFGVEALERARVESDVPDNITENFMGLYQGRYEELKAQAPNEVARRQLDERFSQLKASYGTRAMGIQVGEVQTIRNSQLTNTLTKLLEAQAAGADDSMIRQQIDRVYEQADTFKSPSEMMAIKAAAEDQFIINEYKKIPHQAKLEAFKGVRVAESAPVGFGANLDLVMDFEDRMREGRKHKDGITNGKQSYAKFGINDVANPDVDLDALTFDQAKKIYKERYWDAAGISELPKEYQAVIFDAAVNQGVGYANKLKAEIANGKSPLELISMRRARYKKTSGSAAEKQSWENRLNAIKGRLLASTGTAFDKLPASEKAKEVETFFDIAIAEDPVGLSKDLEDGQYDNMFANAAEKRRVETEALKQIDANLKLADEKLLRDRLAGNQEMFDSVISKGRDGLDDIEKYIERGGDTQFAQQMRKTILKNDPISIEEQNTQYSNLFDRVSRLRSRTVKGKVKYEKTSLEEVVRLQQDIMSQSARGVKGLNHMLKSITPVVLDMARKEEGFDDVGLFWNDDSQMYDSGYERIQGYLEKNDLDGDHALKAQMLREMVTRADRIPEEDRADDSMLNEKIDNIASEIIAKRSRASSSIPVAAITHLRNNPELKGQFDAKYGLGAASKVLGL